jgi:hypothetical protein
MESELIPTPVDSIWSSMDNPFQIPSSPCTGEAASLYRTNLFPSSWVSPFMRIIREAISQVRACEGGKPCVSCSRIHSTRNSSCRVESLLRYWCAVRRARTECVFRYIICAMRSSDRINLSCTNSLKSLLALSHSDVMIVELTESEVVVLMERAFVKRAALGGCAALG